MASNSATGPKMTTKRLWPALLFVTLILSLGWLLYGVFVGTTANLKSAPMDLTLKGEAKAAALKALDSKGLDDLRLALQAKLEVAPLDLDVLITLAQVNNLRGETELAQKLTIAAAARSYRDAEAQLNAVNYHYEKRDFDAMLRHLSALMVAKPEANAQLLPLISGAIARTEPGVQALAKLLKAGVPWEKEFFQHYFSTNSDGSAGYTLLSGLRKQGYVVDATIVRMLISSLVEKKKFDLANFIWLDFLPERALLEVRQVFDGGFKLDPQNMGFDWTLVPFLRGKASITQRPGALSDRVLRVDFANSNQFFANVSQILRLREGKYTATGESKLTNLESDGGLTWRVLCLEPYALLGESAAFRGNSEWSNFEFEFNVPVTCKTQMLRLESTRNLAKDLQISGTAFFDSFDVKQSE